jgi:hypothetical protein
MRIGGAFPFGQGNVPVGLSGGEQWYLPPGNFYIQLGSVTLLQVFDGINQIWRNVGFPGGNVQVTSADGFNYRLINFSGVIAGVNITNAGSGAATNGIGSAVTGVTIGFGAAPTNGIAASAYPIIGGKLSGLTLANAGSGFVFPPVVVIDPPPLGGIQATATVSLSTTTPGTLTTPVLQNAGAGYTSTPNAYIVPQYLLPVIGGAPINPTQPVNVIPPGNIAPLSGSLSSQPPFLPSVQWPTAFPVTGGAQITVNGLTGSGTLTGAVVTNPGLGYTNTTIPTISFSGGSLAGGVAASPITSFSVSSVSGAGGAGIVAGTAVLGATAGAAGTFVATDGCNGILQPRPPRGVSTSAAGAVTLTDPGFGIQLVTSGANQPLFSATGTVTTQPTYTTVSGGAFDISLLQPAVED